MKASLVTQSPFLLLLKEEYSRFTVREVVGFIIQFGISIFLVRKCNLNTVIAKTLCSL